MRSRRRASLRVRHLLAMTETRIGEITEMCGFESDGYLKRHFRGKYGCSMREWCKRNA